MELTSKQRKILEKAAHDLQPVVIVGGAGMTEGVIQMADKALADHELIKVKFNEYKEEKQGSARKQIQLLSESLGTLPSSSARPKKRKTEDLNFRIRPPYNCQRILHLIFRHKDIIFTLAGSELENTV